MAGPIMSTTASSSNMTDVELETLLEAARRGHERRVDPRYAFFTTVTLRPQSSLTEVISAFSREIPAFCWTVTRNWSYS